MVRVIRLPNGHHVTLGEYVRSWRALLAMPADTLVSGFEHFPQPAAWCLRVMRRGLQDRINQRGGIVVREDTPRHVDRRREAARRAKGCGWCGQPIPASVAVNFNSSVPPFCCGDCARQYHS